MAKISFCASQIEQRERQAEIILCAAIDLDRLSSKITR